ncbi:DedA family protein [Rhodohalobacter sp. SW132]|uniref:DedA family protein n=1 Tax=Rhodohalobacter sp. SW132 TaxID=2293433 RepID=UPI000E277D9B|nr:DedA family protein [Rhodohalobacter sp. SW132]REL29060.1 DedA family protein [Rhodohalobacter sp. SW132]
METVTGELIDWILTLSPLSVYAIFALVAYLENVVPPIPGDILVVFGGYLAAEQVVGFNLLLLFTTIASVIGFMNMYGIGYYFGDKIEAQRQKFWLMKVVDVKYFDRGKRWMHRWGQGVILANRFLAGTRSVISVTAGLTKTRVLSTVISATISSLLWNLILLGLGWFVHENWQIIGHYLNIYGWFVLGIIVLAVAGRFLFVRYVKQGATENREI